MKTIHLLRHGQTAWNIERRFLGRTDIALDDVGRSQIEQLAAVFPPVSRVWSSPLRRALDTARAVTRAQGLADPTVDADLVEMDMGELEGMDGPTVFARYGDLLLQFRNDTANVVLPGGETMAHAGERMWRAFARILSDVGPDETIAIVSHQMALSGLLCLATGKGLSAYRDYTQRNTAWTTVQIDGDVLVVVSRDQAPHLDRAPG